MWIAGLRALQKPFLHLHTQYNRDIPWADIDMDFMNLNQSAHGDREFGFIGSRMRLKRKVVVGHWQDADVQASLGAWARAASAWHDAQGMKIARFGDNMREVAVTEGDKVEAQMRLGYSVNGYGVGDLVRYVNEVSESDVDQIVQEYEEQYAVVPALRAGGDQHESLRDRRLHRDRHAALPAGWRLQRLHHHLRGSARPGPAARPGAAAADGRRLRLCRRRRLEDRRAGALDEGDGGRAAGGTSFMEDYTYHLNQSGMKVLGAHMLEICPTIATGKPKLEVHPLGIGGKADPVRLVFDAKTGPALNASVIDMGNRFRMIVNQVDTVPTDAPLPKLPVARALWVPQPNLTRGRRILDLCRRRAPHRL